MVKENHFTNPWENRREIGLFKAWWQTARAVIFSPNLFFSNLKAERPIGESFLFWIIYCITIDIYLIILIILKKFHFEGSFAYSLNTIVPLILVPILMPILGSIVFFTNTVVYHISVLMCGGKRGYKATFHVLAYMAAIAIAGMIMLLIMPRIPGWEYIISIISSFIFLIWTTIITVIGFKYTHQISTIRAIIAAALPSLFITTALIIFVLANFHSFKALGYYQNYKIRVSSKENIFVDQALDFYNHGDDKAIFRDSVTSRFRSSSDFAAFQNTMAGMRQALGNYFSKKEVFAFKERYKGTNFDFYRLAFDVHHNGGVARHYFSLMFDGKNLLIDGWAVSKDGRFLFAEGNLYDMPLEPEGKESLLYHIPKNILKDTR